jgi:hypothetical protein
MAAAPLDRHRLEIAKRVALGSGEGLGTAGMAWVSDHLWVDGVTALTGELEGTPPGDHREPWVVLARDPR